MPILWIAVGGAFGATSRHLLGEVIGWRSFPWTILGINLAGSFLLGWLIAYSQGRWSDLVVQALSVGFLGAFTTFSTFSMDTLRMLSEGRAGAALGYVLASVAGGIALAALGWHLGR